MHVSFLSGHPYSPKDKNTGVSDVDDYSEKFTPENANSSRQDQHYMQPTSSTKQARQQKQQAKEMEQI